MATVTTPIATDATLQNIDAKLGTLLTKMDALAAAFQPNAAGIDYSNTTSGLTSDDVQEAIDENAGAITEIKQSLSQLNTQVGNIKSLQLVADSTTTGATGNIATGISNDGKHLVFGAYASGANVYFDVFVSSINGLFYLKCKDADTAQIVANTSIAYRYYLLEMV